jgi:hypothetical protein
VIFLSLFSINAPAVVSETIEGETVAVNLETGCYYSMNGTAVLLWTLMEQGYTLAQMEKLLVSRDLGTQGEIRESLKKFFGKLLEKELIITVPIAEEETPLLDTEPRAFLESLSSYTEPVLEEFTEMQEMLLLDPIHEVDETGWPNVPQGK